MEVDTRARTLRTIAPLRCPLTDRDALTACTSMTGGTAGENADDAQITAAGEGQARRRPARFR